MKKSVLFLSFVATIAMWSCGAKSTNGGAQGQDSTAMEQTIANKDCGENCYKNGDAANKDCSGADGKKCSHSCNKK